MGKDQAEDMMAIVDPGTMADAARRYAGLRRRYWRSFGGMSLGALSIVLLSTFGEDLGPAMRRLLFLPLALGLLACWAVGLAAWISLTRFRCPRCGKRFIMNWWSSWPTDGCKHCGLDLGPTAAAMGKPPASELWE